jgi:hypothetical protein
VDIPLLGIQIGSLLSTTTITGNDWLVVVLVASSVFVIEEFRKFLVQSKVFAVRKS